MSTPCHHSDLDPGWGQTGELMREIQAKTEAEYYQAPQACGLGRPTWAP